MKATNETKEIRQHHHHSHHDDDHERSSRNKERRWFSVATSADLSSSLCSSCLKLRGEHKMIIFLLSGIGWASLSLLPLFDVKKGQDKRIQEDKKGKPCEEQEWMRGRWKKRRKVVYADSSPSGLWFSLFLVYCLIHSSPHLPPSIFILFPLVPSLRFPFHLEPQIRGDDVETHDDVPSSPLLTSRLKFVFWIEFLFWIWTSFFPSYILSYTDADDSHSSHFFSWRIRKAINVCTTSRGTVDDGDHQHHDDEGQEKRTSNVLRKWKGGWREDKSFM